MRTSYNTQQLHRDRGVKGRTLHELFEDEMPRKCTGKPLTRSSRQGEFSPTGHATRSGPSAEAGSSRVGGDRATIERGRHLPAPATLKSERNGLTLCRHRSSGAEAVKLLRHSNLTDPRGRCQLIAVSNSG